jgi:FMN reductase
MSKLNVVGVSGSQSRPSRTTALVSAVLDSIQKLEAADTLLYDLAEIGPGLFAASSFDRLSAQGLEIIQYIEGADLIVVGTPVYRGSYTGAFKHVFDLVRHDRLRGTPVILTATGGNLSHSLVTEHELRPLFGFFGALSLPMTLYATESDFSNYALVSAAMTERVALAAKEAIEVLRPRLRTARSDLAAVSTSASSSPSTQPPTSGSGLGEITVITPTEIKK